MKKLLALYEAPGEADLFMEHFRTVHLPLIDKIPGLVRTEVTRIERMLLGKTAFFLLAEMYFADDDSFRTAMHSPENTASGADLANFAGGLATVMTGEVLTL